MPTHDPNVLLVELFWQAYSTLLMYIWKYKHFFICKVQHGNKALCISSMHMQPRQ